MAERLVLEFTERGAKVVSGNIKNIGKESKQSARGVGELKKALGAIGAAVVIRELARMSDVYTNLNNRTRLVTSGQAELTATMGELRKIANETRASFEGTAELFNRIALTAKETGKTNQQILSLTRSINQAIALSGAGAQEAQGALIQLAQGLAAGQLRGEELNSVLEGTPLIAKIIANSLGKTTGELKGLAEQGLITADVVFEAFAKTREELEEQFATTVPTISQAFTVLKNELIFFTGEANNASGAAEGVARAILAITRAVPDAANGLADLAIQAGIWARQSWDAILARVSGDREEMMRIIQARNAFLRAGSAFDTGDRRPGSRPEPPTPPPVSGPSEEQKRLEEILKLIDSVNETSRKKALREALDVSDLEPKLHSIKKRAEELGPPIGEKLPEALDTLERGLTDMERLGIEAFSRLDDVLTDTLLHGEDAVKRFVQSVLREFVRLQIQSALVSLLPEDSMLAAALRPGGGTRGRQFGGPVSPGDRVIVHRNEVVTFGQPARVDPLPVQQGAPNVTAIVVNDPSEVPAAVAMAEDEIVTVIAKNADRVNSVLGQAGV
jgi:tape measure domain-containing protein